jgi:hypothetical protein
METIVITCTNNGQTKTAEVMQQNDKFMKVVLEGTQITLELFRQDVNKPYVGHTAGLEFTWQQKK